MRLASPLPVVAEATAVLTKAQTELTGKNTDDRSLCNMSGLLLGDGAFGSVHVSNRMARVSVAKAEPPVYTAICVTGQLRGLPVAWLNWASGPLFRALTADGSQLDLYFVTSNTSSFRVWLPFVESLQPIDVVVADPHFSFIKRQDEKWAVREKVSHRAAG
jgi:hypothetical protein